MAKYINKDTTVVEIEKLISNGKIKCQQSQENNDQVSYIAWSEHIATCGKILALLDTLEVKEVNLEKELSILDNTLFDLDGVAVAGATHYLTVEDVKDIAKHFFELGLNAKKEETKQPEYSCTQSIYHRGKKHYWDVGDILAYYYYSSDCEGEHIIGQIVDIKIDEEQDDWVYTFENGKIYYEEELLDNGIYVKVKKK